MKRKLVKPKPAKPNLDLLKQQGKEHNKKLIQNMYDAQFAIMQTMEQTNEINVLLELDQALDKIEYALQELWGFGKDHAMHKFWYRPKCSCPRIDNEERYGMKVGQIISGGCILHKHLISSYQKELSNE